MCNVTRYRAGGGMQRGPTATKFANSAGDIFCSGHCAKVRCTYVQPGQGRTPRAPGRLSHSCRIVHAQTLGGASASNPMTVAAASASLGSPPRASSVCIGRLRLHSACINPRDRPREAPSAMPNAARRRAPRANSCGEGETEKAG